MTKKRKHKTKKQKTITKYIKSKPTEPNFSKDDERLKKEIAELESKKAGTKGFLKKASINKAIYSRRQILKTTQKEGMMKRQLAATKSAVELQKARGELQELRKRNQVDFSGFGGFGSPPKKQINLQDLY